MAELKTQRNDARVTQFLDNIADAQKRADCYALVAMMRKHTRAEPKMWGSTIVGFGDYHYVYATGREGDWFLLGLAPRKQNLTLYAISGGWNQDPALLAQLGKHSLGAGCLYIKRLADINTVTLNKLMANAVKRAKQLARATAKQKTERKKKAS